MIRMVKKISWKMLNYFLNQGEVWLFILKGIQLYIYIIFKELNIKVLDENIEKRIYKFGVKKFCLSKI